MKFAKKGVLLFAAAMAACAFVLPPMTSAASWGPIGSHHALDSLNLGFTSVLLGQGVTSLCTHTSLTGHVASAQNLEITSASFGGLCTNISPSFGTCTMTMVGTRFPWTATAVTTSNIQLHGVFIDMGYENPPGLDTCINVGFLPRIITGTLSGGNWTGNAAHALDFSNAEGLVSHSPLGDNFPMTWRASFTDTLSTLTVS